MLNQIDEIAVAHNLGRTKCCIRRFVLAVSLYLSSIGFIPNGKASLVEKDGALYSIVVDENTMKALLREGDFEGLEQMFIHSRNQEKSSVRLELSWKAVDDKNSVELIVKIETTVEQGRSDRNAKLTSHAETSKYLLNVSEWFLEKDDKLNTKCPAELESFIAFNIFSRLNHLSRTEPYSFAAAPGRWMEEGAYPDARRHLHPLHDPRRSCPRNHNGGRDGLNGDGDKGSSGDVPHATPTERPECCYDHPDIGRPGYGYQGMLVGPNHPLFCGGPARFDPIFPDNPYGYTSPDDGSSGPNDVRGIMPPMPHLPTPAGGLLHEGPRFHPHEEFGPRRGISGPRGRGGHRGGAYFM